MVKIKTQRHGPFDNGACDMALNLLYITQGNWDKKEKLIIDFRSRDYDTKEWRNDEEFVREPYKSDHTDKPLLPGWGLERFPMEKLEQWDKDNYIIYPLFKIHSVKIYPDTYTNWRGKDVECTSIEIESERDDIVREIFILMGCLGNGGHSYGGYIRINEQALEDGGWVAHFGFDEDGSDRIYFVDDEDLDD